ncbi:MAG: hypothetical protein RL607_1116 [Bacteroidota bacterium]|jgi:phosphate transport system substrate-binding protein
MKKNKKTSFKNVYAVTFLLVMGTVGLFFSCKQNNAESKDTILRGNATVYVDESLLPIVADQELVFETTYEANLDIQSLSEKEVVKKLAEKKAGIAILARKLNASENKFFKAHKIVPRETPFALDALALIRNNKEKDTTIVLQDVLDFLKGKNTKFKGLVFDNPNSASVRYMMELAQITELPQEGVYSLKNSKEVIQYVAEHEGLIGVVGSNWLFEPAADLKPFVAQVHELAIKGVNGTYVYPTQEAIGTNKYPLARVLYIINCQGYEGLGIGFASFIAGDKGQRIVLKSGIAPVREPGRKIVTRKQIEKNT